MVMVPNTLSLSAVEDSWDSCSFSWWSPMYVTCKKLSGQPLNTEKSFAIIKSLPGGLQFFPAGLGTTPFPNRIFGITRLLHILFIYLFIYVPNVIKHLTSWLL